MRGVKIAAPILRVYARAAGVAMVVARAISG
jgi:hypothetical protein